MSGRRRWHESLRPNPAPRLDESKAPTGQKRARLQQLRDDLELRAVATCAFLARAGCGR